MRDYDEAPQLTFKKINQKRNAKLEYKLKYEQRNLNKLLQITDLTTFAPRVIWVFERLYKMLIIQI